MTVRYTLPTKIMPPEGNHLRADQQLYNDVIECLNSMEVGWTAHNMPRGQLLMKTLSNALWYSDSHHDTLRERGINIPEPFDKFHGYNDFKRKKEKKPRLSQKGLNHHVQALSNALSQPWIC